MIIIVGDKKIHKKKDDILSYEKDFVIVNSTTNPKIRNMPNVVADINKGEDGMTALSGISALAFQMPSAIFDETCPDARRQSILQTFLISPDFTSELANICTFQITNPRTNIYVVIEQQMYKRYLDDVVRRMNELIRSSLNTCLIFTWHSINEMHDHLVHQISARISSFDEEKWREEQDFYEGFFDSLEDDDYDRYLDALGVMHELEASVDNGDVRQLFMRYAEYSEEQLDCLEHFVKVYE